MSNKLEGKVALVTGGTSGIGLATAQRFASEGAEVVITGRRKPELDAAMKAIGHKAIGVQGDVGNLADLDRLYAAIKLKHGHIDVLFANAGGGEIRQDGRNHRGTLRQDLQREREGAALHSAESAAAVR